VWKVYVFFYFFIYLYISLLENEKFNNMMTIV
jgi:hypothetical protein